MAKSKTRAALEEIESERARFVECFGKYPDILAWILNECGLHRTDPTKTTPGFLPPDLNLIAFANRLLAKMGSIHTANLVTLAQMYVEASNDEDLVAAIKAAEQAAKED